MNFETKRINSAPDAAIAPDGSEVRLLCGLKSGRNGCIHTAAKGRIESYCASHG